MLFSETISAEKTVLSESVNVVSGDYSSIVEKYRGRCYSAGIFIRMMVLCDLQHFAITAYGPMKYRLSSKRRHVPILHMAAVSRLWRKISSDDGADRDTATKGVWRPGGTGQRRGHMVR